MIPKDSFFVSLFSFGEIKIRTIFIHILIRIYDILFKMFRALIFSFLFFLFIFRKENNIINKANTMKNDFCKRYVETL